MGVISFKQKKIELTDVIVGQDKKVVYVDFVLASLVSAIEKWYKDYYQNDAYNVGLKAHLHYIINFYKRERFMDHDTIGDERQKYLEEIDLYIQMRRED